MTDWGGITAESGFLVARGILMPMCGTTSGRVTIIIPHYKGQECLKTLLLSVANQTFREYNVVIIDDCTPDGSVLQYISMLIKDYDNMRLARNDQNLGFVKTCNRGVQLATGEYVCLLNQDTEVKSNFVERNVEILDANAAIGALTCIVVDRHGEIWFSGGRYKRCYPMNLTDDFQGVRSVDFVAGTAAFYRRDIFDKIGLFDEKYIMYHEDVEFGLRLRYQTNYRLCVFSDKLVTHFVVPSIPTADKQYYATRNAFLMARRYASRHLPRLLADVLLFSVCRSFVTSIPAMVAARPSSSWRRGMRSSMASAKGALDGLLTKQSRLARQHHP